jgi:hypothetical protein
LILELAHKLSRDLICGQPLLFEKQPEMTSQPIERPQFEEIRTGRSPANMLHLIRSSHFAGLIWFILHV